MPHGADGLPDPAQRQTFAAGAAGPVDLPGGPGRRPLLRRPERRHDPAASATLAGNDAPTARATATPTTGAAPLTVQLRRHAVDDPDGDALTYAWDLDGDGDYDDSTAAAPDPHVHRRAGAVTVRLRVTDPSGLQRHDDVTVTRRPPADGVDRPRPPPARTWTVGDAIEFSGSATDAQAATLPASA